MRAKLKEEHVGDAEAAVKRMLAAFERESIEGIRYVSVKLQDVVTVPGPAGGRGWRRQPLPGLPEAHEFYDSPSGVVRRAAGMSDRER